MLGGSAWESNPPGTVLAPHTGFEVRELHQTAAHFRIGSLNLTEALYYNHCFFCQYLSPTLNMKYFQRILQTDACLF